MQNDYLFQGPEQVRRPQSMYSLQGPGHQYPPQTLIRGESRDQLGPETPLHPPWWQSCPQLYPTTINEHPLEQGDPFEQNVHSPPEPPRLSTADERQRPLQCSKSQELRSPPSMEEEMSNREYSMQDLVRFSTLLESTVNFIL